MSELSLQLQGLTILYNISVFYIEHLMLNDNIFLISLSVLGPHQTWCLPTLN